MEIAVIDLETHVSAYDFDTTVSRIESELAKRGIVVFAHIDHAANAESVGLSLPPTTVLIFGNPKGGTPVMAQAPSAAYELPLRLLIRQDAGSVLVEFAPPDKLLSGLGLAPEVIAPLHVITAVVAAAVA